MLLAALLAAMHPFHQGAGASGQSSPESRGESRAAGAEEGYAVGMTDILHTFMVTGELKAERSRNIVVPRIRSGFASTITFLPPEGYRVRKGDRILEYDAATLLSQKSEAQRKLDEAKLKIAKTRADLGAQKADLLNEVAQAAANLEVAQLYGRIDKELLPANQYQKYQLDLEKAQLALDKAKERLANHEASLDAQLALVEIEREQAELELQKSDSDLALLAVDAPQDGIVIYGDNWASNRKVQVGDTLFPGMTVLTLPDLSSMQVVGYVYDTELRHITPGKQCELHLDAVPGRSWKGRVSSVTSVAARKGFASQHKVFRAVIDLDAVDLQVMKPGMTMRIEIPVKLASNTLAVPRELLGIDGLGRYFVSKGTDPDHTSVQPVETGAFNALMIQIVSGLKAGDRIFRPRGTGRPKS